MEIVFPEALDPQLLRIADKATLFQNLKIAAPTAAGLEHKLRIELTHGSTSIEGNTLTLRETQLLIDEGITPAFSKNLRELHEVTNHDAAVKQIQRWVEERKPLSVDAICEIHALILKNIDDDTSGRFRNDRVLVTGAPRQPIRPEKIADEMSAMESAIAHSTAHPVVLATKAHYRFVKIHPFLDGNGRTARLLMNWLLLRAGYPLTVIAAEDRARYITAIDQADLAEPNDFCSFICECVERSLDQYLEIAG